MGDSQTSAPLRETSGTAASSANIDATWSSHVVVVRKSARSRRSAGRSGPEGLGAVDVCPAKWTGPRNTVEGKRSVAPSGVHSRVFQMSMGSKSLEAYFSPFGSGATQLNSFGISETAVEPGTTNQASAAKPNLYRIEQSAAQTNHLQIAGEVAWRHPAAVRVCRWKRVCLTGARAVASATQLVMASWCPAGTAESRQQPRAPMMLDSSRPMSACQHRDQHDTGEIRS